VQSCPARFAGRCLPRHWECDGEGPHSGEDDNSSSGEGAPDSSRATTRCFTGSDTDDADLSSGCGGDETDGPCSLPTSPSTNTSSSSQADKPVVVLRLSNVLADISQAAKAAPPSTGCQSMIPCPPPFAPPAELAVLPSAPELPPPPRHVPSLQALSRSEAPPPAPRAPPLMRVRSDAAELPSVGSAGHGAGRCKPCAFFHTVGCENAASCVFCHLCAPGEKKRRQKERKDRKDQKTAARKLREKPTSGCSGSGRAAPLS
jgi:hypothetical protein